jgi:hypothetical protein
MKDGKLPGVKEQSPDAEMASEKTVVFSVTVFDITDDRMRNAPEMSPDLVSFAGHRMEPDQGIPARRMFRDGKGHLSRRKADIFRQCVLWRKPSGLCFPDIAV